MSKKKWLIVAGVIVALGVLGIATLVIGLFVLPAVPLWMRGLPVYRTEQTDSTHPWYRRTVATSGTLVFVNDYEEYALRLVNYEPTHAVGRAPFGDGKICSIDGQNPTNYIAVDCGSEMPAYEVFRNQRAPAFDWRHAKFQSMELTGSLGPLAHKRTADLAFMVDVVHTLSEGKPTTLPLPAAVSGSNLCEVCLSSDELPGLLFCPEVHRDATGSVYLAENIATEFTNRTMKIHARWIPASPLFTKWVQTP